MHRVFSATTLFSCLISAALSLTLVGGALAQEMQAESRDMADTTLRDQAPEIATHYGTVMVAPDGARYVIYGPLNRLWQVSDDGRLLDHAWIEVHQKPFEHIALHWSDGTKDIFNLSAEIGVTFTKTSIPLVAQYDRLLTEPLASPVDPLPAGAYFSSTGHVFNGAGVQVATWDSRGKTISLHLSASETTDPDTPRSDVIRLAVADLVGAMEPEPK